MRMRLLAAAVLLPAFLVIILVLPPLWTAILMGILAAMASFELLFVTGFVRIRRLVAYSALMAAGIALWSHFGQNQAAALLGIMLFVAILFTEMMASGGRMHFEKLALCIAAGILIPYLFTALVRLRSAQYGKFYIMIPLILAFVSDAGAYFVGRFLGKHKLAPRISPNKTIEGVVGGVCAAVIGMMLYTLILDTVFGFEVNYPYGLIYGLLGALASVFGDLSFSAIKRQTGIKDYGNLIPGHGGVLDRFDSMTVVAPVAEVLVLILPLAVK